jgi:catechol 2,3-dioxygenase-like lactoylglutathione lyase family enzyme
MTEETGAPRVRRLRLVVRADDYDAALTFFRDVLGLPEREAYSADGGAEVTILRGRGGHARDREPRPGRNARVAAPEGVEITIFQELGPLSSSAVE